MFRLGHLIQDGEVGNNIALIGLINNKLIQLFRESEHDERLAVHTMQEILKTPNRPLHKLLVQEITRNDNLSCRFHFKFLATWQKELKCQRKFEMTDEERKLGPITTTLLKKVVNDGMIAYINTLPTR